MLAYNDCDGEVKMDINALSTILKMFSGASSMQSMEQNTSHTSKSNASAFAVQNGLGEQVTVDNNQKSDTLGEILKNLSGQNPLLGLLGSMQGSNGDLSSLLTLVTSLMNKPKTQTSNNDNVKEKHTNCDANAKNQEKTNMDNASNSEIENANENNSAADDFANACKNGLKDLKEKTQRDLFAPVAFSGYKTMCALYNLIKATRHPCR